MWDQELLSEEYEQLLSFPEKPKLLSLILSHKKLGSLPIKPPQPYSKKRINSMFGFSNIRHWFCRRREATFIGSPFSIWIFDPSQKNFLIYIFKFLTTLLGILMAANEHPPLQTGAAYQFNHVLEISSKKEFQIQNFRISSPRDCTFKFILKF